MVVYLLKLKCSVAHGLPLSQLCHTSINILLQSNPILGQSIWIKFSSEADVEQILACITNLIRNKPLTVVKTYHMTLSSDKSALLQQRVVIYSELCL